MSPIQALVQLSQTDAGKTIFQQIYALEKNSVKDAVSLALLSSEEGEKTLQSFLTSEEIQKYKEMKVIQLEKLDFNEITYHFVIPHEVMEFMYRLNGVRKGLPHNSYETYIQGINQFIKSEDKSLYVRPSYALKVQQREQDRQLKQEQTSQKENNLHPIMAFREHFEHDKQLKLVEKEYKNSLSHVDNKLHPVMSLRNKNKFKKSSDQKLK